MPELPEVEVLVRHLTPLLTGRTILGVTVRKPRLVRPDVPVDFTARLQGAVVESVGRRGKFLRFSVRSRSGVFSLTGHLGMTGRMYLRSAGSPPPRHAAVIFDLGKEEWLFEDVRGFGRMTLDPEAVAALGPEPLGSEFTGELLRKALQGSQQAVKVRLLDQSVLAGVGNIYASEALFRAGISPRRRSGSLGAAEVLRLRGALVEVLEEAIRLGSSLRLDFAGDAQGEGSGEAGLFYYGRTTGQEGSPEERFRVYDRSGLPCVACGTPIRRIIQAARSTYFCPRCQR